MLRHLNTLKTFQSLKFVNLSSLQNFSILNFSSFSPFFKTSGFKWKKTNRPFLIRSFSEAKEEPDPNIPPELPLIRKETDVIPEIQELADKIASLNMVQYFMLMNALAAKTGVSLDILVGRGGGGGGGGMNFSSEAKPASSSEAPAEKEKPAPPPKPKTSYNIKLLKMDEGVKYKVLKEFRALKPNLSLTDAKKLLENLPKVILENTPKEEGEKIIKQLLAAGATAELE